ncbi:FHF complex subunit HOOK interacting protein 2A-like isoform X2 [Narcine bancroftii]|uniref:FHF complex subunit HOOK interacting protein 2A-like isoform X2 n=1 Tax=Narcine bancroftii TaxID=1343680 RepID=UPI003831174B
MLLMYRDSKLLHSVHLPGCEVGAAEGAAHKCRLTISRQRREVAVLQTESSEERDQWLRLLRAGCATETESTHLYEEAPLPSRPQNTLSNGIPVSDFLLKRVTTPNAYMDDPFGQGSNRRTTPEDGDHSSSQHLRDNLLNHQPGSREGAAFVESYHHSVNKNSAGRYNTLPSAIFLKSWSDFETKMPGDEKEARRNQSTQTEKKDFKEAMDSVPEKKTLPRLEEKIRQLEQAVYRAKERVKSGSELNLLSLSKTFKRTSCGQTLALFSSNSETAHSEGAIVNPMLRRAASAKSCLRRTPSVLGVEKGKVLQKTKEEEPVQLLESFIGHWKGITNYYIVTTDEDIPVKQTDIPWHLRQMVDILAYEEKQSDSGETGPCLEYFLQHKILETLCTLAKAGYPPGMKQQVLVIIIRLLGQIQQPLLPHVNVHRPVQKLICLCGVDPASKTKKEEVQFLTTVCMKLKQDPYLLNFFIENLPDSKRSLSCSSVKTEVEAQEGDSAEAAMPSLTSEAGPSYPDRSPVARKNPVLFNPDEKGAQLEKNLFHAVLTLTASQEGRFAFKACEGLLLLVTLPEEMAARYMVQNTALCRTLADRLSDLYKLIPEGIDPGQVESLGRVHWRSHGAASSGEDEESFPGKGAMVTFFSWLDYCNDLVGEAHTLTAAAAAREIRTRFFLNVLEPQLLQVSEIGILSATALLKGIVSHVTSSQLLDELVHFLLGDERQAEVPTESGCHPLRSHLIERCNHLSDEISLCSLRFFEQILQKSHEHIIYNLVLRNLSDRCYIAQNGGQEEGAADNEHLNETEELEDDPFFTDIYLGSRYPASDWLIAPASTQEAAKANGKPGVSRIVHSFLCLVPDAVKTSHLVAGSSDDTYLLDAHRLFQECCSKVRAWNWPRSSNAAENCCSAATFYEGDFLKTLFDRMAQILHQPYELNLQMTSVISKLALFPHPHLHEYLLDPYVNLVTGCRSLFSVIVRVIGDLMQRIQRIPQFDAKLLLVRRQLMGLEPESMIDHATLLKGVIVLEEFCKELAAISFVKCSSELSGDRLGSQCL